MQQERAVVASLSTLVAFDACIRCNARAASNNPQARLGICTATAENRHYSRQSSYP